MNPGGTQLAATTSVGMGTGQGVAPARARARILEPEIEMKSSYSTRSRPAVKPVADGQARELRVS